MRFIKSNAYGNDFLLVERAAAGDARAGDLARATCDRHAGVGADGLILYDLTAQGAVMRLLNADGSRAEVSGNGLRCLAALVIARRGAQLPEGSAAGAAPAPVIIETEAGAKPLTPIARDHGRVTFRAAMGPARNVRQVEIDAAGERVDAVLLSMGNPQCVIAGPLPAEERFRRLGAALEHHPLFPEGTNVEFSEAVGPAHLKILIWERGVGPTMSSGTGTCAAAAAAASVMTGDRDFDVTSPGGTQRVEVRRDNVYLTGWAELVFEGEWPDRDRRGGGPGDGPVDTGH
jgi:diaminopimelate epimerase